MTMLTTIAALAALGRDLLLPRGCAGCDAPDEVLCAQCVSLFSGVHRRALPSAACGAAFTCAWYRGRVRQAILAWKDHDDVECDRVFVALLGQLVRHAAPQRLASSAIGAMPGISTNRVPERPLMVVPAPSSFRSLRRRRRRHILPLARGIAKLLRDQGVGAEVMPVLYTRGVATRSVETTSTGARSDRIAGRIAVRGHCVEGDAIVIDDIITTGTTMGQCVRALRGAGIRVVGVFALAQTPGATH